MARPRAIPADAVPWIPDAIAPPTRDARGEPLIRLQTLGAAVVQCGETRIAPSAGVLFALLLRLTHAPAMRVPREQLLATVWPEQRDERRRASLRQALYKLRGFGVRVGLDGDVVQLDSAQLVRTFASERTSARFERDVTAGHEPFGPFLPGYIAPTAPLEEWVSIEREAVHADVRHVLVTQLRARRERADWSGAEALARWLLRFDPLHEDATLMVAECTMLAGAKAEAIAILDRYLAELGPNAGDIRLPALQMRRRFVEATRGRISFAPTERHFVGREEEITALTLAMRRARWRDGSAVLLHGPSGIGKTRLTIEAGKVATVEAVREVRASCCESDGGRILSVILDMLPELMSQPGALGCEPESMATLRRLVPEPRIPARATQVFHPAVSVAEERAPSAATVEGADDGRDATTDTVGAAADGVKGGALYADVRLSRGGQSLGDQSLGDQSLGDQSLGDQSLGDQSLESVLAREPLPMPSSIRRAIVDLVAAVSDERPLMLVIDNVHWIDPSSWDVLADITERISEMRLVLLLTSRVPYACATRPERIPMTLVVRELPPLKAASSASLARLIGEDLSAPMSDAICEWFVDVCEGSPLFLRSLVNHWIETGEAGGVPPTLQQVIETRISKLSPDALRTLQAIAMLGELASVERAQRVLGSSTRQLLDSLEELARAGAFRDSEAAKLGSHELLGRAAMGALRSPALKMLDLRIAEVLSADSDDEGGAASLAVIEHLRRANEMSRLADYARERAELLLRTGYPTRALAICDAAKLAHPGLREDPSISRITLEALYLAGRYSQLLDAISQRGAAISFDAGWDSAHPDEVLNFIEAARHADTVRSFADLCARAVMLAESDAVSDDRRFRASTTALRVAGHGMIEGLPLRAYRAGSAVVERTSDPAMRRALLDMYFHTAFGDPVAALAAARKLRADYLPTRNPRDLVCLGSDVAYALRVMGAPEEAHEQFEAVYREAPRAGVIAVAGIAAWYLSLMAMDSDSNVQLAAEWISRCEDLPGASNEELLRCLCAQQRARHAILRGDVPRAFEYYSASKLCFVNRPDPKRLAYSAALELGMAEVSGDVARVKSLLPDAQARFIQLKNSLGQDYLASRLVRGLRLSGRAEAAQAIFAEYVNVSRRERSILPRYLALSNHSYSD